ncbi:MAG: LTA synthase family protein, partial [Erysipelotrichaceae bacterium]
ACLSIVVLISGIGYTIYKMQLNQIIIAYFNNSNYIEEHYVSPNETSLNFPQQKRNLIHIYLESVENTYLSKELGGVEKENLMPYLTELTKEGIVFSDNEKTFGGAYQTFGSEWSIAAMVNMEAGVPLKVQGGNSYGTHGYFLPGIINLGDILEGEGYNQTIMFGADAKFGGLDTYFTTHGKFKIYDYYHAIELGKIDKDYYEWWGFEDSKLFEYAKEELLVLSNSGKPFHFNMETADTHFPDGYVTPTTGNKFDKQYANVIAHSDKQVYDFIRWIQQQDFYENTTIVLTGDHLSMDKNYFKNIDSKYRRSVFNLILNAPIDTKYSKNRHFGNYDMFPTILRSMGVKIDGNRLGIGTDLFSGVKTIIEKDGYDFLQREFNKTSIFFDKEFLDKTKDSIYQAKR